MDVEGETPVEVYVASWNTVEATELCIRSMRATAGYPLRLTVGDGGSSDGSVEVLEDLAAQGYLDLEVEPGRGHAGWLDVWINRPHDGYVVFSDSDIQFLRSGWLAEMVDEARRVEAAVVHTELIGEAEDFADPLEPGRIRVAARPAPWLVLIDTRRLGPTRRSFELLRQPRPDLPEQQLVWDVGAQFFDGVAHDGLLIHQLHEDFRRTFRHYGGLSWDKNKRRDTMLLIIRRRLSVARRGHRGVRSRLEYALADAYAFMLLLRLKLGYLRDPSMLRAHVLRAGRRLPRPRT